MDATTLVMFMIPIIMALAFSFAGLFSEPSETDPVNFASFSSSLIAMICWLISAFIWPMLATMEAMVWIGWLWFGLFFVFAGITLWRGFNILRISVLKSKSEVSLEIRERENEGY